MPTDNRLIALPLDGQPHIAGNGCILAVLGFYTGKLMHFLRAGVWLVVLEMTLHAGDDLLGHQIRPPLGIPAVGAGDVLIRAGNLDDASDLRIEGIGVLVANAGIAQIDVFAMVIVKHTTI